MERDIAIYGAGGFGKEVACLINAINSKKKQWKIIGFFDDVINFGTKISHFGKVLGGIDAVNSWNHELALVLSIGNVTVLKLLNEKITNPNIIFPNLIHPTVDVLDWDTFNIGKGNIIQRNSTGSCNVTLGNFNILNSSVQIGHDVTIGSYNVFMPTVRISGTVSMGNQNFFGVGSIVLQQLKIGNNVKLGAGSVMITKPKDGNLYIGNPAKKIEI